jgi:YidC/Oxa1 family membrane protein insertase
VDLFELLGWLWAHVLVIPMTNFLVLIAHMSFGHFGIAIIIFTLITRAVTWPLTRQQLHATRAMQAAQPRIQEIQKTHKDPKRRSEETMKVYRELGINPLGCIWPMLVQMPIWFALYQSISFTLGSTPENLVNLSQRLYPWSYLRTAVPLENHFLWLDLAQPDGTFIMAILVGGSAWVQQKMSTPPPSPNMDPQQAQMNQTMLIMMPLMFAFFTLQFPSGLALYWVATNVVSIVLQYFYMGRKVNWRQLFTISPAPAPAPAVRPPQERERKQSGSPEATQDKDEVVPEVTDDTARKRRRRRGGRRRR